MKLTPLIAVGRINVHQRHQPAMTTRAPRVAIKLAGAAMCAGVTICGIYEASSNEIFRCVVVESRHISEDGKQERYPNDIYAGDTIVADTRSALVRLFGNPYQFVVAQVGSKENGWVLTRRDPGPGSTSVQLLAIQIYRQGIPFVMADGMQIYSGNCSAVR